MNYEPMRSEIPTAVLQEEAQCLADLAAGKDCMEVGSHLGFSTIVLGLAAKSMVSVDYHRMDGDGTIRGGSFPKFLENLERYGLINHVTMVVAPSDVALPLLRLESFDLIFIDGDHDYEPVKRDILNCLPLLRKGGVLAFHDYGPVHFGVRQAVDEILGTKIIRRVSSVAITLP